MKQFNAAMSAASERYIRDRLDHADDIRHAVNAEEKDYSKYFRPLRVKRDAEDE